MMTKGFTIIPNSAWDSEFWKHLSARELYIYIMHKSRLVSRNTRQAVIGSYEEVATEIGLTKRQIGTAVKILAGYGMEFNRLSRGWQVSLPCTDDVPMVYQRCTDDVTEMYQRRTDDVTNVLQPCNENQPQNRGVVYQSCTDDVTEMYQRRTDDVPEAYQRCTDDVPEVSQTPIVINTISNKQEAIINTHTHNNNIFNNTACACASACACEENNQSLLGNLTKSCGECVKKERGGIEGNASEKRLRTLAEEIYKVHPKHGSTTNMMKIIETVLEDAGSPGMTLDMAIDKFETATRQYLDEVKSWNKTDLRYAIPLDRWCSEKRYQEDPAIWAKNPNKANGGAEGERFAKHGYSFDPVNERGLERAPHEIAMMEALEEATKTGVTMSSLLPKYYAKHGIPIE